LAQSGGDKTIEVTIRFTTDGLSPDVKPVPKHAWTTGFVYLRSNPRHGIKSQMNPRVFNSFAEIPATIEKALIDHGITLHASSKERKLRAK
jgi:hypothetical protein